MYNSEQARRANARRTEMYSARFLESLEPSEHVFDVIHAAVKIGVFKQSSDKVLAWAKKQPVLETIVLFGLHTLITKCRKRAKCGPNGVRNRRKRDNSRTQRIIKKAKQFDRIVELLDHKPVGAKVLGDCKRSDLLRAAAEA